MRQDGHALRGLDQYNELGQVIHTTAPAGVVTTYGYDQLGHRTTQTADDGESS